MDWRDEKIDFSSDDNFFWSKNILTKSRSEASFIIEKNCSNESQLDGKESKNFSLAFEKLELDKEFDSSEEMPLTPRSQETQTCQCPDCIKDCKTTPSIRSREISSLRLIVQGPEILNQRGVKHSPEEISPYFKKDSRMWLWKSQRTTSDEKIDPFLSLHSEDKDF